MFAKDFKNGYAIVTKEYPLTLGDELINTKGKVIFKTKNSEIKEITKGFYGVNSYSDLFSRAMVYDANGNVVIPNGKYSRIETHN